VAFDGFFIWHPETLSRNAGLGVRRCVSRSSNLETLPDMILEAFTHHLSGYLQQIITSFDVWLMLRETHYVLKRRLMLARIDANAGKSTNR